ncbi:MAG: hypothetical protein C5B59_06145 [Bacteroidetes bacterium]|nr:MAG: hypothetical protein C5B59_06145 [Bacteroidota bacterium]
MSALSITISLVAEANTGKTNSNLSVAPVPTDTLPDHDASDEIDRNVQQAIQSIDWNRIRDQIAESVIKMNGELTCGDDGFDQMEAEIDRAIKELDLGEIKKETLRAMQHGAIDFDLNDIIESAIENSLNLEDDDVEFDWSGETSCIGRSDLDDSLESAEMELEENSGTIKEILIRSTIK